MKIVVMEEIHEEALEMLKNFEIVQSVEDAETVIIRAWTNIDSDFISKSPNLKYVVKCGAGLDNIDLRACEERGIKVFSSPGSNANSVAEHTVALILAMVKDIVNRHNAIKEWNRSPVVELSGKTIGLLGLGAIGKSVAKKLSGFDVKMIGFDIYVDEKTFSEYGVQKVDLNTLLEESNIVTIHVPLLESTKHMISERELRMLKGKYIVNTSRGQVIDEKALIEHLKSGSLAGAALDVFSEEPFSKNNELADMKNVILSPHIGSMTSEGYRRMCVEAVQTFIESLDN